MKFLGAAPSWPASELTGRAANCWSSNRSNRAAASLSVHRWSTSCVMRSTGTGSRRLRNPALFYCSRSRARPGKVPAESAATPAPAHAKSASLRGNQEFSVVIVHSNRGSLVSSDRGCSRCAGRGGLTGVDGMRRRGRRQRAMNSFFALLQKNALDRQVWDTTPSSTTRSSTGSNTPTTADAIDACLASSPRPIRPCLRPSVQRGRGLIT
jgi:hypothetical protein